MSIGEIKISCYLESKVAFGSGPSVAQKLKIKQTLCTKQATKTREDLVKQDLSGKSVSHVNPAFYMPDSEGLLLKKCFIMEKYIQKRRKED